MLCDECGKNEARFHSVEQVGNHKTERHLCAACQKKYGEPFFNMSGFNNFFSNLSDYLVAPQRRQDEYICPSCGTTGNEFLRTGFVGCAECYKEFAPLMLPAIKQMQGDVSHVGKVPSGVASSVSAEYDRLKTELRRAVSAEDFETAVLLQEKMRQLKGE